MRKATMRRISIATFVAGLVIVMAAPAFAHVTATPDEGPAGGFFTTWFKVGHGCEESPTVEVSIQIPEGVTSVAPEAIPGWTVETVSGELAEPVEVHGEMITEGVQEVTWTADGDGLDAHQFLQFGLGVRLPDGNAGDVLYFPFVQSCPGGASHNWVEIPDSLDQWDDLEEPAPYVVLTAADGGHGDEEDEAAAGDESQESDNETDAAATSAEGDDADTSPVTWAALGVGVLALIVASASFKRKS